jgi:hypothetical protein
MDQESDRIIFKWLGSETRPNISIYIMTLDNISKKGICKVKLNKDIKNT